MSYTLQIPWIPLLICHLNHTEPSTWYLFHNPQTYSQRPWLYPSDSLTSTLFYPIFVAIVNFCYSIFSAIANFRYRSAPPSPTWRHYGFCGSEPPPRCRNFTCNRRCAGRLETPMVQLHGHRSQSYDLGLILQLLIKAIREKINAPSQWVDGEPWAKMPCCESLHGGQL